MKNSLLSCDLVLPTGLFDSEINKNNRILYLDFIKLLAAFLTVFYHFSYYRLDYGFVPGETYTPNLTRIVMCISACCVPLFFMVNGYLILSKERSVSYLAKKIVKIAILMAVWSLVGFPSWFFRTLCILYVLVPVFQFAYRKHKALYAFFCGAIFLMPFCYNLLVMIVNVMQIDLFPLNQLHRTGLFTMYSILYFLLGPILANFRKIHSSIAALIFGAGLVLVTWECVIYTNIDNVMFDGVNAAFPTIGALLLSSGVFILCRNFRYNKKLQKILTFASGEVLAIFLMHMMFINIIYAVVLFPSTISLFTGIFMSCLVFTMCVIAGKLLSKIPVLCWLLKI